MGKVTVQPLGNKPDLKKLVISAVDVDGINATVFQEVKLSHNGNPIEKIQRRKSEKEKEREELEAREARRALRDAQRAKLRMALKAKKMEQKKREQASNGNTDLMDVNGINATVQEVKAKHNGKSNGKQIGSSKKPQESEEEFPFQIQSKMLESTNNDHEQKEKENASNPSNGLVANLSSRLLRRLNVSNSSNSSNGLVAELSFFGNFGEPQLLIPLQPFLDNATSSTHENGDDETLEFMCRMTMDIPSKSWNIEPYSVPEIVECWIEKEEREQREAQQQAYDELERRVKERKALRAKKLEEKKKEQLLNGNNEPVTEEDEPVTETAAESKDDDSNLLNGNQPEDSSEP